MTRRILLLQPPPLVGREQIALVVDVGQRDRVGADFVEHLLDGADAAVAVGRRRVDHVQHEIGIRDFFERRAKRRDERVRQPVDEPDGVRQRAASRLSGSRTWRTSGSSVTNSAFDASASARVSTLNSVVLPALV